MKIMDRVLKALFRRRKDMSAKEIAEISGLKLSQVTQAIYQLLNRKMIIKTKVDEGGNGPKKPYIRLRDIHYTEKYLIARGML